VSKVNILLITDYFLPGYNGGGPIKSVANLSTSLNLSCNVLILTGDRDLGDTKKYENIKTGLRCKVGEHNVIYEGAFGFSSMLKHIRNERVNLIWLNSFFSIYSIKILLLKKINFIDIPVIVSPRGELSQGGLSIKSIKKYLFIYLGKLVGFYSRIFFHSTDQSESISIHKILGIKSFCIPNLCTSSHSFSFPYKESGRLKVVFLSRISQKKNLLSAIKIVNLIKSGEVIFDIYGPPEDQSYLEKCILTAEESPPNVTINFFGGISSEQVPITFSKYHVFLLPTLNENYGHAIVEAMLSGMVPVISNNTPWKDLQCYDAGWDLDLGNLNKFSDALGEVMAYDDDKFREVSSCVVKYISQRVNNLENISKYKEFISKVTLKD
jgi:glycosyltransferase involved in cell wall biosynthesis